MLFLQRLLGALIGVALLVTAFFVASVVLAIVAVVALALWAWVLWRTRSLPRRPATGAGTGTVVEGEVIEGEYRVEREIRRGGDDPR